MLPTSTTNASIDDAKYGFSSTIARASIAVSDGVDALPSPDAQRPARPPLVLLLRVRVRAHVLHHQPQHF
jgi:hypothetical protein